TATGLDQRALERRLALPDTLVLFDGLDEAPAANPDDPTAPDRRQLIAHSVQAFCTAHPECPVLVTSRVKPYTEGSTRLDDIPVATLAELDDPRIRRFVSNWYRELTRIDPERAEQAGVAEKRLQLALRQRPALREMAGTPLLLTMLAAVNTWAGLPESRAELYDKCVEQLLWEWEKKKESNLPGDGENGTALGLVDLLREPGVALQRADVERVLWELTFHAHAQSGAETADLPAADLRAALAAIHPKTNEGWAWANRVVGLMAERGGLLVESATDVFTFPHRSFQEYLAARWLLTDTERAKKAAELAESDTWREVVLLACGYLTQQGRKEDVQALIAEVTDGECFDSPENRRRLLTGGMAWLEYNSPPRATGVIGRLLSERIPPRLTGLMQHSDAPPAQRLEAGLLLADLGDLPSDLDEFVAIGAADALGYDFAIGKYPVTNAQFRRFFDAGGYDEDQPWWTPEAVADIERYSQDWRKGPRLWGTERFNRATQPVVGVSWYEAAAYCEWLTGELRESGEIGQNSVVRLAKEAEWAFVASPPSNSPHSGGRADALSGKVSLSADSSRRAGGRADASSGQRDGPATREYAWGDDFAAWRVNSKESGHDQTTPVHMHPGGATLETDVWDLCGNVWEWGLEDRSSGKVLLGGAYWYDADGVRASSRGGGDPRNGNGGIGLRCVVVPGSR
ncbi:MAG: SUMF1/EgtB/PvdO family nonheme iron enzyme, partial [Caldilineaceae bacterium]